MATVVAIGTLDTKGAEFFGASSMERLPTEIAITGTVRRFKALRP